MTLEEAKSKFRFRMKLDIRWSDMDEMRHVNNAVYLTYFEQARVYYFHESCQWDWKEIGVILANAHIEYMRPLVFSNPSYIYMRTSKLGNKSFELQYLIGSEIDGKEELITTGYTTMVMYDYATGKPFPIPEDIKEKIKKYEPEAL